MSAVVRCLDVAREAGVSPATVSLVLNGRTKVALSTATRHRVREVALRLGYRPNHLARSLLRGSTQTLGVVLPSLASSFVARIAEGIQVAAGEAGFQVLLAHSQHDARIEARQFELLLQHKVDGILIVAGEATLPWLPERLDVLEQRGVGCVVVDDRTHAGRVDCVVSDDQVGAERVVQHLVSLGHRRIAHVSAGTRTSSALDRSEGYRAGLRAAGLPLDPALHLEGSFLGPHDDALGLALLQGADRPSALFAANDRSVARLIPRLQAMGVVVPRDLAMVGYADYEFATYLGLSSVDQHPVEMGRQALVRLLQRIEAPAMPPMLLKLPVDLVLRRSCGAPVASPCLPSSCP